MNRFGLLPMVVAFAVLSAFGQPSPRRTALVVSNSAYRNLPGLPGPGGDARAMAQGLTKVGFKVQLVQDAEIGALATAVDTFLKGLGPGEPGLFYYSGYAVQDKGENFLLPVGFEAGGADAIEFSAYSLKRLERYMEGKKLLPGILLVEPARMPPALSRHFGEAGMALMDVRTPEMLVSFASLPGQAVQDAGARPLSFFTQAWIDELQKPWTGLDLMSRHVKQRVAELTNGAQSPAEMSTLMKTFAFQARAPQELEWEALRAGRDLAGLRAFVQKYPGDPLAVPAAARVQEVDWALTEAQNSPGAVREFLARYPGHALAAKALSQMEQAEQSKVGDGVLVAIDRYSKAYSEKDLEALKQVRPSLSAQELRTMEQSFRMAKSLQFELKPTKAPEIVGKAATVPCEMRVEMRMDRNSPPPMTQNVVVKLSRVGTGWVIDSIR